MEDTIIKISIPSDDEGFVLLQCPLCGIYFKLRPSDYEDDSVLYVYCPSCGLSSDNYMTNEVIELAHNIASNYAMDVLFEEFKELERKTANNRMISFKAGSKPRSLSEEPIKSSIEAMTILDFNCCNKQIKTKPLLKMTGCYCPFCGVKEYEFDSK